MSGGDTWKGAPNGGRFAAFADRRLTRREFHYDNGMRSLAGVCGVLVFGFGVFCLFAGGSLVLGITSFLGPPPSHPLPTELFFLLSGPLWVVFGVYCIRIFFVRKDYAIIADQEGVSYLWPQWSDRKLIWTEIAALRFRPILQRLDLIDSKGASAFSIDCEVEQFGELLDIVVAQVLPHLRPVSLPRKIATKLSRNDVIVGFMILLIFVCAIISKGQFSSISTFAMAFAVFYLSSRFFQLRYLVVTTDSITLAKGLRARTIPFSDVKEATLRVIHGNSNAGARFSNYPRVRLTLADGSEVGAQPLACDPFEVLRTIQTAMSMSQR
jgi:hypothetical protein